MLRAASELKGVDHCADIKQVQCVELGIFDEFLRVCSENELQYFLIYGSLLGAIRHKGFIPWDDDMDIIMPRKDYDFLVKHAEELFSYPFQLQYLGSDESVFYGGYCKLRNSMTTALDRPNWKHSCNQGISIDIFPLDVKTEEIHLYKKQMDSLYECQFLLYAKAYGGDGFKHFKGLEPGVWQSWIEEASKYDYEFLCHRLTRIMCQYNDTETGYLADYAHGSGRREQIGLRWFYEEDFSRASETEFEGRTVRVPQGYHRILQTVYGEDYMCIPLVPPKKGSYKVFYNISTPYHVYAKRLWKLPKIRGREKTILLGEEELIDYFRVKNRKCNPIIIYDCQNNWQSEVKSTFDKDSYLILCSTRFVELEEQLTKMDIQDYYIYTPKREWLFR